ncbi:hypothetical protein JHK82_014609 [Glycine max]|nr:hypothetical protein JHK85_014976 [Glycine max]KAG5147728.1 hypothetical protein JHK82_014609 [Glycine max]
MDKIKYYPKMQNGAVISEVTQHMDAPCNARKGNVVEKITRRVQRDQLFDLVVMSSVRKKPDLRRIQEKTLEGRATCLCNRIKMEEKILIILNDLWGAINLGKIGIPFGNDQKGCKILLVSSHNQGVVVQPNENPNRSLCESSDGRRLKN